MRSYVAFSGDPHPQGRAYGLSMLEGVGGCLGATFWAQRGHPSICILTTNAEREGSRALLFFARMQLLSSVRHIFNPYRGYAILQYGGKQPLMGCQRCHALCASPSFTGVSVRLSGMGRLTGNPVTRTSIRQDPSVYG